MRHTIVGDCGLLLTTWGSLTCAPKPKSHVYSCILSAEATIARRNNEFDAGAATNTERIYNDHFVQMKKESQNFNLC